MERLGKDRFIDAMIVPNPRTCVLDKWGNEVVRACPLQFLNFGGFCDRITIVSAMTNGATSAMCIYIGVIVGAVMYPA